MREGFRFPQVYFPRTFPRFPLKQNLLGLEEEEEGGKKGMVVWAFGGRVGDPLKASLLRSGFSPLSPRYNAGLLLRVPPHPFRRRLLPSNINTAWKDWGVRPPIRPSNTGWLTSGRGQGRCTFFARKEPTTTHPKAPERPRSLSCFISPFCRLRLRCKLEEKGFLGGGGASSGSVGERRKAGGTNPPRPLSPLFPP